MTVYNQGDYVRPAIESLLRQTVGNFDFIVVDDGSEDHSYEEILRLSDPRLRIFRVEHRGRGAALNFALAQTNAPWIAFADADDISVPDRLSLQQEALKEDQTIDAMSGSYQMVDATGASMGIKHLPANHGDIVALMPVHCSMCFPAALIRRETLTKIGGFNERFEAAIDYDLWLRMIGTARFRNLSAVLLKKRITPGSISVRLKDIQSKGAYEMANRYLTERFRSAIDAEEQKDVLLQLGKLEYYHGTMKMARRHLRKLLWNKPHGMEAWRFYVAGCLGDVVFRFFREKGIATAIGGLLRGRDGKGHFFSP